MRETLVFFRDDDVGEMTDSLRFVMQTLIDASVPCHYQVVPDYLDADSAVELKRWQAAHPLLIFLNQHGFRHAQELDGQRRATEFDGGRPFESQFRDISRGKDMLVDLLGDSFSPDIFTPPCHKYDGETLRALGDLGFATLSAGVRADSPSQVYYAVGRVLRRVALLGKRVSYHLRTMPDPRLCEVSVSIDVHEDQDKEGRRVAKSAEMLWREFEFLCGRLSAVGVMLHHQACDTAEKRSALREFVHRLGSDSGIRFATISQIAATRSAK